MAVYKENIVDIDLAKGSLHRSFLTHTIGSGDVEADHFGVRVFRDGEPVDLTDVSVQGIFNPPQGSPIALTSGNVISGNVAAVVLKQACYNYNGQFCLSIKLVGGGVTGTMRIVDGVVDNTHSTGTVAPTEEVPTYQEVIAQYDAMVAATAAANGAIAKPYAQLTFPVKKGDYTIVDGALKRALVDIATSETYTAAHWTDAKLGPDLSQLKSAMSENNEIITDMTGLDFAPEITFTDGYGVKYANGQSGTNANRSRCGYIPVNGAEKVILTMIKATSSTIFGIAFYGSNAESSFISGVRENYNATVEGYEERAINVPEGANYFRTSWVPSTNPNYSAFSCKLYKSGTLPEGIDALDGRVTDVEEEFEVVKTKTPIQVTQIAGSYAAYTGSGSNNGKIIESDTYAYAVVDVTPGKQYFVTAQLTGYLGVNFYNGTPGHDTLISGFNESTSGSELNDYMITAPTGATKLAVSTMPNVKTIKIKEGEKEHLDLEELYEQVQEITPVIATVGTGKDYEKFTDCLAAFESDTRQKEIHIYGGTYDILSELGGAEYISNLPAGSTWRTANKIIPPNTKIIGHGNVIIKMELSSSLSSSVANLFAPINIQGSCHIKNVTIIAKNCRYCIHAEGTGLSAFSNSNWIFEDCYINKTANEIVGVYQHAIGMGINNGNHVEIKNCVIKSAGIAMGMHDNGYAFSESPVLDFNNSVFVGASTSVSFRSTYRENMAMVIKTLFANCHLTGAVEKTTATANTHANDVFAVTYLKTDHTNSITQYVDNVIADEVYD